MSADSPSIAHMERLTARLATIGLEKYADAFADEGYDDFDVLAKETEAERKTVCGDIGMAAEDIPKFLSLFEPAAKAAAPLLVACYGAPNTIQQGRDQLAELIKGAEAMGLATLVLDASANMKPVPSTWDAYVALLLELINKASSEEQRIFVFGFSWGTSAAYAVAEKLGARCEKLYVTGGRAPHITPGGVTDVWGVQTRKEYLEMPKAEAGKGWKRGFGGARDDIAGTWVLNQMGDTPIEQWPSWLNDVYLQSLKTFDGVEPKYTSDIVALWGEDGEKAPKASADLMAIAGAAEQPAGETPKKMERWAELTSGKFEFVVLEGVEHAMLVDTDKKAQTPGRAISLVLEDLRKRTSCEVS